MRESTSRSWHRWRVTVADPKPAAAFDPASRLSTVATGTEVRGPDGIRHELVARIRQQIADGTYDTEEKWALAEEALLRRVEGRA
ncbi:MAG: flagellar biosynthesis anti-sigma factor FlgM [Planctomycetes bacterium]|nr:flagellar biosynthesis anti-sigma factor FlgM [Planctomycetota bacterium]